MTRCRVLLLGRFEVSVDGRVVPSDAWRSRRAADLVKVLALQPSHALHREQVMALLWPELGAGAAAANLRKAVPYSPRAMGADEAICSEVGLLSLWGGHGRGVAQLMLGEAHLMAGQYELARGRLRQARRTNAAAHSTSVLCVSLERLAQAEVALARRDHAHELLARARPAAEASPIRSHLLVRLLGVGIQAAADPHRALTAVIRAERTLIDATRVCEPCSMDFRIQATVACAQAGDVPRARHHLADAERIAGLWQGGPWTAAVWEARATLRYAEGQPNQAVALLYEAADEYARAQRHADERRCRAAASAGRQPHAQRP